MRVEVYATNEGWCWRIWDDELGRVIAEGVVFHNTRRKAQDAGWEWIRDHGHKPRPVTGPHPCSGWSQKELDDYSGYTACKPE
jgi:hypothetical protein